MDCLPPQVGAAAILGCFEARLVNTLREGWVPAMGRASYEMGLLEHGSAIGLDGPSGRIGRWFQQPGQAAPTALEALGPRSTTGWRRQGDSHTPLGGQEI